MDCDIEYPMQSLYIAKTFYDHGRLGQLLERLHDGITLSWDELGELERTAAECVFEDTKYTWQDPRRKRDGEYHSGCDIYILRDPILTRYDQLCRAYEAKEGISKAENPFSSRLCSAVQKAMYWGDYCHDYRWVDGSEDRKGPKLVLLLYDEFDSFYVIPDSLFSILDFCAEGIPKLEAALAETIKPVQIKAEQEAA